MAYGDLLYLNQPGVGHQPTTIAEQAQQFWQKKETQVYQPINQYYAEQRAKENTPPPATDAQPAGPSAYEKWLMEQAAAQERQRQINAIESLRGVMESYGLSSLMGKITEYVKQGYDGDAVRALIRTTPEYKERFPAMDALAKKGRAISESAYIEYERNAAQLEKAYGLPSGILGKNAVTGLLTNEVSANELENRVVMAAAGAYQAPQELKDTFLEYYGIDSGGLTAYFLDPEQALPLLNKQYVSSQIGAEAAMQDFNIAVGMAENLQQRGITQETARQGFQDVARQRGFMQGRGDVVTQEQLVSGTLLGEQESAKAIERSKKARLGQFAGGGGYTATQAGVGGLGSAATR